MIRSARLNLCDTGRCLAALPVLEAAVALCGTLALVIGIVGWIVVMA